MADPDGSPLTFSLRETPTVTSIGDPEPVVWATTNIGENGPTDSTFYPHLAFGADGNLMVVRMSAGTDGASSSIVGQLINSAGQAIGPEVNLSGTAGLADADSPHVAALGTGGYVVSWSDSDFKSHGQIVSPAGEPVGAPFLVSDGPSHNPDVLVLDDGNILVTYFGGHYSSFWADHYLYWISLKEVHGRIFDDSGAALTKGFPIAAIAWESVTPSTPARPSSPAGMSWSPGCLIRRPRGAIDPP